MPDGGGMDGGATGAPGAGAGRAITGGGGACEGEVGTGTAAAGGGVAAPGPPMRCSRDLRSIFGFLSSAIVRGATLRAPAPPCQRDDASEEGGAAGWATGVGGVGWVGLVTRVLVIDNYDSFTFNLVQYLGELGAAVEVFKNDAIDVAGIRARGPSGVLVSPGPCTPNEAGVSLAAVKDLAGEVPVLGVCLGHQSIGQAFGGRVVRAARLMHGKTSPILHDGRTIFADLPDPFEATRYHSLIVERESLPACLEVSAWTAEGEIMGLRHRQLDVEGVQFHPESVLTTEGKRLVGNWVARLSGVAAAGKQG
jgi:anthranilate synthase/aminodeoxychorismate synthase-like glutamine amidotransferase